MKFSGAMKSGRILLKYRVLKDCGLFVDFTMNRYEAIGKVTGHPDLVTNTELYTELRGRSFL